MAQPFCLAAWRTKSDTLLGLNQILAHGEADQIGLRLQVELSHEIGAVGLGRAGADEKFLGDLGIAQAFRRETSAPPLSRRKRGQRIRRIGQPRRQRVDRPLESGALR